MQIPDELEDTPLDDLPFIELLYQHTTSGYTLRNSSAGVGALAGTANASECEVATSFN